MRASIRTGRRARRVAGCAVLLSLLGSLPGLAGCSSTKGAERPAAASSPTVGTSADADTGGIQATAPSPAEVRTLLREFQRARNRAQAKGSDLGLWRRVEDPRLLPLRLAEVRMVEAGLEPESGAWRTRLRQVYPVPGPEQPRLVLVHTRVTDRGRRAPIGKLLGFIQASPEATWRRFFDAETPARITLPPPGSMDPIEVDERARAREVVDLVAAAVVEPGVLRLDRAFRAWIKKHTLPDPDLDSRTVSARPFPSVSRSFQVVRTTEGLLVAAAYHVTERLEGRGGQSIRILPPWNEVLDLEPGPVVTARWRAQVVITVKRGSTGTAGVRVVGSYCDMVV